MLHNQMCFILFLDLDVYYIKVQSTICKLDK